MIRELVVIDFAMVWDWVMGDGSCGSWVSWMTRHVTHVGHGSRNVTHCQLWAEWLEIAVAQWLHITMESLY